jgi:glycosyltransferase involved in cell wall biosynthesis
MRGTSVLINVSPEDVDVKESITYQILIPAYNAGETISLLLNELASLRQKPLKITVVDDGSVDDTFEKCKLFDVEILRNRENRGKGSALKKGFQTFLEDSNAAYLLCMDADLQHPVSSIPDFLQKAAETRSSFIIGSRLRSVKAMPFHRILSNAITSRLLSSITGQKIEDSQCGYRLIHRKVLENVSLDENGYQLESELLLKAAKAGIEINFLPIETIYASEKSHMRHFRDTYLFIGLVLRHILKKL